jgi:hypothetical protein
LFGAELGPCSEREQSQPGKGDDKEVMPGDMQCNNKGCTNSKVPAMMVVIPALLVIYRTKKTLKRFRMILKWNHRKELVV